MPYLIAFLEGCVGGAVRHAVNATAARMRGWTNRIELTRVRIMDNGIRRIVLIVAMVGVENRGALNCELFRLPPARNDTYR